MPRVLVVGGGGREHALSWALRRSPSAPEVHVAPGNAGIARDATCHQVSADDLDGLCSLTKKESFDLVVVGPEAPLAEGLADRLREEGTVVLGPSRAAAQLEASKRFAKEVMDAAGVPTARWSTFERLREAKDFVDELGGRAVVKADGLAGGKGVFVAQSRSEAFSALDEVFGGRFGDAGSSVVVEEFLEGEELSVIGLVDGRHVVLFPASQDHKRLLDGDQGLNTGGMGAYAPAPRGTKALLEEVVRDVMRPTVREMEARGTPFSGVLYAGLMLTSAGLRVLEFNVRFGDPEAQVILSTVKEDLYSLFLRTAQRQLGQDSILEADRHAACVVLAAHGYPTNVRKGDVIEGLEDASRIVQVFHAGTVSSDASVKTAGGRVLGVTGFGEDLRSAIDCAYGGVSKIRFDGMQFRSDIAHRAL